MERQTDPVTARLVLAVVAVGGAGVALVPPRPVPPVEAPSLELQSDEIQTVLAEEARLARAAPGDGVASELRALFVAQNEAEAAGPEPREARLARARGLEQAVAAVRDAHGPEGLSALRAASLEQAAGALDGPLALSGRNAPALGSFPTMLLRYGLTRDGRRVAPTFVVRTLYKARWNAIARLPLTDGFTDAERRAYWGWLALHAESAPVERREAALEEYGKVTTRGLDEARGTLAWEAGRFAEAAAHFARAYARTGSLRLRNHELAALEAESAQASPETTTLPHR